MNAQRSGTDDDAGVSRRELLGLFIVSLATMLVLATGAEVGSRWWWPQREANTCYRRSADGPTRPAANCSTRLKNAEGPWTTMRYDECGYRSLHSCGQKAPGIRRVVIMGTSIATGLFVPDSEYFAPTVETALSAACGFPVELLPVASVEESPDKQVRLLPEVERLKPDAVVMLLAPYDLLSFPVSAGGSGRPPTVVQAGQAGAAKPRDPNSRLTQLRLMMRDSRALLVAQHFILNNEQHFLQAYRLGNEDDALRVPLSPEYRARYDGLEAELRQMGVALRANNIPLLIAAIPNRIQAALISNDDTIPGRDAWGYFNAMQAIADRNDLGTVDVFHEFAKTPHAERQLYYAVDGHVNGDGDARIARAIYSALVRQPTTELAGCAARSSRSG